MDPDRFAIWSIEFKVRKLESYKMERLLRSNTFRAILVLVMVTSFFVVVQDYCAEFLAVDSCLDRGGVFDYASMTCVDDPNAGVTTLPYIPYTSRKWIMLLTVSAVFCFSALVLLASVVVGRLARGQAN